jgi:hypothetical protein
MEVDASPSRYIASDRRSDGPPRPVEELHAARARATLASGSERGERASAERGRASLHERAESGATTQQGKYLFFLFIFQNQKY